jgi:hypothetical protein
MEGFDESSGFALSNTKKPLQRQGFYGLLRLISAVKITAIPGGASHGEEPWSASPFAW